MEEDKTRHGESRKVVMTKIKREVMGVVRSVGWVSSDGKPTWRLLMGWMWGINREESGECWGCL